MSKHHKHSKKSRRRRKQILLLANYTCQDCLMSFALEIRLCELFVLQDNKHSCIYNEYIDLMKSFLEIHHILPLSEGGTHDPENLVCLCTQCHMLRHKFNALEGFH